MNAIAILGAFPVSANPSPLLEISAHAPESVHSVADELSFAESCSTPA